MNYVRNSVYDFEFFSQTDREVAISKYLFLMIIHHFTSGLQALNFLKIIRKHYFSLFYRINYMNFKVDSFDVLVIENKAKIFWLDFVLDPARVE